MRVYNYQIGHESLHVDARFARTLAYNGEAADAGCWIMASPAIDGGPGCVGIYLATNGDPTQVATLDGAGEVIWYLGEEEENTEALTIASCLSTFDDFIGYTPSECAQKCADLFAAAIEYKGSQGYGINCPTYEAKP